MESLTQRPSREALRAVLHYLVDCTAEPGAGGGEAQFGAVQPAPPPPKALVDEVCSFLRETARD